MDMAMDQLPVAWPNVEKSANFTADIYGAYVITGTCTVTDPTTPVQGKGFECYIRNGTATIGGTAYAQAGTVVRRIYHSGAWATGVYPALSGAYTWTGQQTFTQPILAANGSVSAPSIAFNAQTGTGFYRSGNSILAAINGELAYEFNATNWNYNIAAASPVLSLRRVNGSLTSPTAIALNDALGSYRFSGWYDNGAGSTGYGVGASISAIAMEAFSSSSNLGTALRINTTPVGSGALTARFRFTPGGQFVGGDQDALTTFVSSTVAPRIQNLGTNANGSAIASARFSNDANGAPLLLAHSRGASVGTYAATSSGDVLGDIQGMGVDSTATDLRTAARFRIVQDAAGGASAVPGRMTFETATSGGTLTEALRIDSAQQVQHLATTASTSTTTGGSTFAGGVGVAGAAFIGQGVTVSRGVSTDFAARFGHTGNGATAWANNNTGVELVAGALSLGRYTSFVKFGSTDSDLTTTTPKFSAGIAGYATETWAADTSTGMGLAFFTSPNAGGTGSVAVQVATLSEAGTYTGTGGVLSTSQTAGIGYATGAGGTVTQITSRTTGVTLNRVTGAITLVSAAGSAAWQSFTVTNSAVAATDTIIVNQVSGTDLNMIHVTNIAAGSFRITFATTGGTTVEQPVFRFTVIKSVSA